MPFVMVTGIKVIIVVLVVLMHFKIYIHKSYKNKIAFNFIFLGLSYTVSYK